MQKFQSKFTNISIINQLHIIIITFILFCSSQAKFVYPGYYSLPAGSILLDVCQQSDNLLIAFKNTSSPTFTDIIRLNTVNNSSVYIGRISKIFTKLLQTYSTPNFFINSDMKGELYQSVANSTSLSVYYSWDFTGQCVELIQAASKTGQHFYSLRVSQNPSTLAYTTVLYFQTPRSFTSIYTAIIYNRCTNLAVNEVGNAYIICSDGISNTYLYVYNSAGALLYTNVQPFLATTTPILSVNYNYAAVGINARIFIYYAYNFIWTYTFQPHGQNPVIVTEISMYMPYLCAKTNENYIGQMGLSDGKLYDQIPFSFSKIKVYQNNFAVALVAWNVNDSMINYYNITEEQASLSISLPINTNVSNNISISNDYNMSWYLRGTPEDFRYEICSQGCLVCEKQNGNCTLCSQFYVSQNGQCFLQPQMRTFGLFFSIFNTFKLCQTQILFIIINNLELYQFHNVNYTGLVSKVVSFSNFIIQQSWSLLPFKELTQFLAKPIPWLSDYTSFTNYRFLQVEGNNLSLIQTLKPFFLVYLPCVTLFFVFFNQIFYMLFEYKCSVIFRNFSFWLYLFGVILLGNIQRITFLFFIQMQNLYSFGIASKLTLALSIILMGVWIGLLISLLPLYRYFYGKLEKYFYVNISRFDEILTLMINSEVLKAMFQGIVHASLLENHFTQIIYLILIEFFFFIIATVCQMKYRFIKCKMIFCFESCISFSMILVNLLILIRYHYLDNSNDTSVFEQGFQSVFTFIAVLVGLSILMGILDSFFKFLSIEKKKQNSPPQILCTQTPVIINQIMIHRKKVKQQRKAKTYLNQKEQSRQKLHNVQKHQEILYHQEMFQEEIHKKQTLLILKMDKKRFQTLIPKSNYI